MVKVILIILLVIATSFRAYTEPFFRSFLSTLLDQGPIVLSFIDLIIL